MKPVKLQKGSAKINSKHRKNLRSIVKTENTWYPKTHLKKTTEKNLVFLKVPLPRTGVAFAALSALRSKRYGYRFQVVCKT